MVQNQGIFKHSNIAFEKIKIPIKLFQPIQIIFPLGYN